jgi:histidinol-phosphate aminotransferase
MTLFRSTLAQLKAYVPTPPKEGHRLHLNEAPEDLPRELKQAILERLAAMNWAHYPEETELLVADLARVDGWRPDGVLVGNGSNEFLQSLIFATLAPGDAIVLASPSFSLYATQARAAGARIVDVPLRRAHDQPFRFDVDALIRAANDSSARIVLIATPNNPTGTVLAASELKRLHDETRALIAVDEAYRHFGGQDTVPLLAQCERMVLMRTYSKSFAAAALRLGYLLGAPAVCTELHKLMMPYNLGSHSIAAARELLRHPELLQQRIEHVVGERARVADALSRLPRCRVEVGGANFVLVEHAERSAKSLAASLSERGLLVRDLGGYAGCERCLRISIGTVAANDALIAAMSELA